MKKNIRNIGCAGFAGFMMAIAQISHGQTAVESTTTTTTAGTISELDPDTIVVKTETAPEPIRYHYTKTTTYVDENGNPVSMETVKSGLPVKVFYDREGDGMVARKVVVQRSVSADPGAPGGVVERKTTTTTAAGTISEFGPQQIVVRTDASAEPVRYRYTKTTTYVDENGNPVSMETVKSGLPVTVYYDQDGGNMVARKVIVRRATVVQPDAPVVIEHKKTTTTTTEDH